jgi:hypothetical protein
MIVATAPLVIEGYTFAIWSGDWNLDLRSLMLPQIKEENDA